MSGSTRVWRTVIRGLSDACGSWKTIWKRARERPRKSSSSSVVRSTPSNTTDPAVGGRICITHRAVVLLPQPDSPTSDRVSRRAEVERHARDCLDRFTGPAQQGAASGKFFHQTLNCQERSGGCFSRHDAALTTGASTHATSLNPTERSVGSPSLHTSVTWRQRGPERASGWGGCRATVGPPIGSSSERMSNRGDRREGRRYKDARVDRTRLRRRLVQRSVRRT